MPGAHQVPTSEEQWGKENKIENLVGQKQFNKVETKQKMYFFLYFLPADNVQPLLGMQGFSTHIGFFRRQIWRVNGPFFFILSLSFCCNANPIWFGQLCPLPWFCPSPALPSSAKTQVCYQHLPQYHCKAQHCGGCCGENWLCLSQTQCSCTPEVHLGVV